MSIESKIPQPTRENVHSDVMLQCRKSPRVNLRESSAILENKSYVLLNWSKDGGLIQGYNGSLLIGDETSITLEIGSSRGTMNIHGTTRIEWRDEDKVGLSWTIPVDRNLDVLQLMIEITLDSEPW